MSRKRVLLYSHEGLGLGHLARTCRIANRLSRGFNCLVATGQKAAANFLNPEVDFIKLPDADMSFAKRAEFLGRHQTLGMSDENASHLRREMIDATTNRFRPHALLSDHSLTGLRGELVNAMNSPIPSVKYLVLRPVLGDAARSRSALLGGAGAQILADSIDRIIVTGDNRVSSIREDLLPGEFYLQSKVVDVGFAITRHEPESVAAYRRKLGRDVRPWVVCSAGAGFRNYRLGKVVEEVALMAPNVQFDFIQGHRGAYRGAMPANVAVHSFVQDLPMMHAACDVLLCHAGYNTLLEGMAGGARVCVIDCDWEDDGLNDERRSNVERMSPYYPIELISDHNGLYSSIVASLNNGARAVLGNTLNLNGLDEIAELLERDLA